MKQRHIISATDPAVIQLAVTTLRRGGLVVYPTETCYGIGVDATNQAAVDKLLSYKTRREGKPISVAVSTPNMAQKYVKMNATARNLYTNYLPGPLTVVSKGRGKVAKGIESEYGTLGIRIPNYQLVLDVVTRFGKPITSTSANVSYKKKPYSIASLLKNLPEKKQLQIDLIIDAGELPHNETSTVVDTTLNDLTIIREGQISFSKHKGTSVLSVTTSLPEETRNFGSMVMLRYLDHLTIGAVVFALGGELGSGKTQFAKGIATTLNIDQVIKSPTFSLINPYKFKHNSKVHEFIHVDTWRLADKNEFTHLQLDSSLIQGNVIAIEWADKFFSEILTFARKKGVCLLKVQISPIDIDHRRIDLEELQDD
jgi:L-threonylcarbamoyladenylate synthase